MKTFYLGTHHTGWLGQTAVPLFVSHRRLQHRKKLPRAIGPWALDSGAFSEIGEFGRWTVDASTYAGAVRRYRDEIGEMAWCSPQDWMCEPAMVEKTGLSVRDHQQRTLDNYLELVTIAPDLPWIPVLQGFKVWQYWEHIEAYSAAGVDLAALPLVGIGSVCRRQGSHEVAGIFRTLWFFCGLRRMHGFGVKKIGIRLASEFLVSADSMAWSWDFRHAPPLPGHAHKNCANCMDAAMIWRNELPDEWLTPSPAAKA